jgi:hypothetical protein
VKQYYYTVASLPALRFEEAPFLDLQGFQENCAVEMSNEDRAYVFSATILLTGESATNAEALETGCRAQWNRLLREFQQQAAIVRSQNLGWEIDRLPRPDVRDATIPERLRQILNEENPLKTEMAALRWLWQAAEALEPGHHFDRDALFLYHLKLQISLRRAALSDSDAGNEEFDRQYDKVAESLMEIAT